MPWYCCSTAKPKGTEEQQRRGGCHKEAFLKHILGQKEEESNPV